MENLIFQMLKHIGIIYHFICDYVQKGAMQLEYISIDEQVVDILMKSLLRGKHVYFRDKTRVVKNTFLNKKKSVRKVYKGKVFLRLGVFPRNKCPT